MRDEELSKAKKNITMIRPLDDNPLDLFRIGEGSEGAVYEQERVNERGLSVQLMTRRSVKLSKEFTVYS
jgi:hypothetical protein